MAVSKIEKQKITNEELLKEVEKMVKNLQERIAQVEESQKTQKAQEILSIENKPMILDRKQENDYLLVGDIRYLDPLIIEQHQLFLQEMINLMAKYRVAILKAKLFKK